MPELDDRTRIVATYPLDAEHVVVRLAAPLDAPDDVSFSLADGLPVRDATVDDQLPDRVALTVEPRSPVPLIIDHVVMSAGSRPVFGPPFAHGPLTAMEAKVPLFERRFPFSSRLAGVHVSVACCTGCDGGVHDRGLVVLNDHLGGGWSGIWVKTAQRIEGPYPRWQRMLFAGGVIQDHGSTEVVDHGWMEISKDDEEPHHPPPPLSISTVDVPAERTTSLRSRSLDGSWVEFSDVLVEAAEPVEPPADREAGRLPYTQITFQDQSGARSVAYVFQEQRSAMEAGTRIASLRGFIHAEAPGEYVLLTDKPEDIQF
jgi:hypothetical protein